MAREIYAAQVALLVRLLPFIALEEVFALKGGTAINLFYRDMPRLPNVLTPADSCRTGSASDPRMRRIPRDAASRCRSPSRLTAWC